MRHYTLTLETDDFKEGIRVILGGTITTEEEIVEQISRAARQLAYELIGQEPEESSAGLPAS